MVESQYPDQPHGIYTKYLTDPATRRQPALGDAAALAHLIDFLRRERVLAEAKPAARHLTPAEAWVQAYARYMRVDRGLSAATIRNYTPFIDQFLTAQFGTGPVQ